MKFLNLKIYFSFLFKIAKNRYSGDLGIMPLDFDKQSLSYAQKTKKKVESAENPQEQPAPPQPEP